MVGSQKAGSRKGVRVIEEDEMGRTECKYSRPKAASRTYIDEKNEKISHSDYV